MKSIQDIIYTATSKVLKDFEPKVYKTEEERLSAEAQRLNLVRGNLNDFDGLNCEKCLNRGYLSKVVKSERNQFEIVMASCACNKSRKSIRNLKKSGLEDVLKRYTFENFTTEQEWQKKLLEKAKRFLREADGEWFFVGGASGSGKSHICSAIAIELLRRCKEVKYMLWKDESRKIKQDSFDGGELIEFYKNVDVLYIDDFFKTGKAFGEYKQKPTPADINIAYEIISSREHNRKTTIISSESTIEEIFEIDEATAGRIKQNCGLYCIDILKGEGKNYRKENF